MPRYPLIPIRPKEEHVHVWILTEQSSVFGTNLNEYTCKCKATKDTFEPWGHKEQEYADI
jgi:hypothetical protein